MRTHRGVASKSVDQGFRHAEVAVMRRTSLTLAADTFNSLAVSRTPGPSSNAAPDTLHLERRRPRPAQALAR